MKETIEKLLTELDKPNEDIKKQRVLGLLNTLMADVEDAEDIPDDVMLALNQDARKLALMGLCVSVGVSLQS